MNHLKAIDLFCGCGGLSLGFINAGVNVVAALDHWEPALNVYRENLSDHPVMNMDLSNVESAINVISGYSPNLIIGGPPCQDFSSAGKRDESLGRADLTFAFAEIVSKVSPEYFVMENVERAKKSAVVAKAIAHLENAGYKISISVLDASLCKVPQKRKRLFIVGSKDYSAYEMPNVFKSSQASKPMTVRDYFHDKLTFEHYYRHPRSYMRRGVFSIDEPSPTIRGVNRPIPKGYPGHPGDTAIIGKDKIHVLTTEERALIQTFPRDFVFKGSKSIVEQIIGNAVPVKLAEFVANSLVSSIASLKTGSDKPYAELEFIQPMLFEQRAKYG